MTVSNPKHIAPSVCFPVCEVALLAGSQVHCLSFFWCNCCWRYLTAAVPGFLIPAPAACMALLVAVQQCLQHGGLGAALMGPRRQGQPPSQRGKLPESHAHACLHKNNADLTSPQ